MATAQTFTLNRGDRTITLPGDIPGTLTGVHYNAKDDHWMAVWSFGAGRVVHDRIPRCPDGDRIDDADKARAYALAHPRFW